MSLRLVALLAIAACTRAPTPTVRIAAVPARALVTPTPARALVASRPVKGTAYALGDRALVVDGATLEIVREPDAPPLATRMLAAPLSFASQPGETPVQGALVVGQARDGAMVALDASTLRDVWSVPRTGKREYALHVAHANGTIAVDFGQQGSDEYEVVAFDEATGAQRWSRRGPVNALWGGGSSFYVDGGSSFVAIDSVSGAEVFRRERFSAHHVVATDSRLVTTWGDDTVRVLDARTGREIAAVHAGVVRWGSEIALGGDTVYAYASEIRSSSLKAEPSVLAIDLASGALRWRHSTPSLLPPHGGTSTGGLALSSEAVIFCTSDGVVHALNRSNGNEQWSYGVGRCSPIVVGGDGGAAWIEGLDGSDLLLPGDVRPQRATFSGVVALGDDPVAAATVAAFGATTTTDAHGRYTFDVTGQGNVVVSAHGAVPGDDKCDPEAFGDSPAVALDGQRAYHVDVAVGQTCSCGAW